MDISIAVSGPKGLMVPVRNAENMNFADVEREISRLATKVRDGKITIDEMTGGHLYQWWCLWFHVVYTNH